MPTAAPTVICLPSMDEHVDRPDTQVRDAPVSRGPAPAVARPRAVRRTRRLVGSIVLVLLAIGGTYWFLHRAPQTGGPPGANRTAQAPPQPVGAETIATGDIRIILNELGTVTPLANVTVRTQINGQLTSVGFQEGQLVRKATSWRRSTIAPSR